MSVNQRLANIERHLGVSVDPEPGEEKPDKEAE
jgi:hypothetical protein